MLASSRLPIQASPRAAKSFATLVFFPQGLFGVGRERAMGLNVVHLKIVAFGASCCFAGIAGALLAHTANFISPDQFQFGESINILAMVVVGGLGSLPGAVIGALLLVILPEALRSVGDFRMIAIGSIMFFSILLLPKGLLGEASALSLLRRQFGEAWSDRPGPPVGWR